MTLDKARLLDNILLKFKGNISVYWANLHGDKKQFSDIHIDYFIIENNINYLVGDGKLKRNDIGNNEYLTLTDTGFATMTDLDNLGYVTKAKKDKRETIIKYIGFIIAIATFVLLCFRTFIPHLFEQSQTTKQIRQDSFQLSDKFYKEYRLEFLNSDLMKYTYDPRQHFAKADYSQIFFKTIIFQDSAIRIFGISQFNKEFNLSIDTTFGSDVIISKQSNGDLALYSADKDIKTKQIISNADIKINPVTYFQNLRQQISTYHIIAIEKHPNVNTMELIFSDHDFLIYKPDSLVFKTDNKDFMRYLFKDSVKLDNNWYQFNTEKNID